MTTFAGDTRARERQADFLAAKVVEIADTVPEGKKVKISQKDGTTEEHGDQVDRSRLMVDARKWLASKPAPKKYGQRSLAYPFGRLVAKSKHELGWRHQSDDCPPIRPPHGWDAPDAGLVPVFNEGVDRRRKPALVPGGFHV